ncbi:GD16279 [Drosophila simulans]|uniref:GD16279 n=1 Tax=Drosophila simulans TaxID=7240 RepID=B4R4P9_DROSI|nr:GD16279 [Drosophila simulans]
MERERAGAQRVALNATHIIATQLNWGDKTKKNKKNKKNKKRMINEWTTLISADPHD